MDPFILLLINMLLLVIVIILIALYLTKKENSFRKQLLDKMDRLIEMLEKQNHK
jgi:uncharacterized protein YoxC